MFGSGMALPANIECYHEQMSQTGEAFEKLVTVMRTLRSPDGCPWDREQTIESLTRFVLEEAHEVVDAIERGNMDDLREEIGDHIFEGVFLAQVASDRALFTVDDSLRTVIDKLVRRHPHVFQEDGRVHDPQSVDTVDAHRRRVDDGARVDVRALPRGARRVQGRLGIVTDPVEDLLVGGDRRAG